MTTRRRALPAALLVAAAAMLTACAASPGLADLERPATEADRLPDVPAYTDDSERDVEIVEDSSRLVGEYDGVQLWLTRTVSGGACLLTYPNEQDWVSGCTDGPPLLVSGPAGTFIVIEDGGSPPENAVPVSENVFALVS